MDKPERWLYAPISDEAAREIAETAASVCGGKVCEKIGKCHRDCMVLIGGPHEDVLSEDCRRISLDVTIWCNEHGCSIHENHGPDSIEKANVSFPSTLVSPAITTEERKYLMCQALEQYERGAEEGTEMEVVRWY